MPALLTDFFVNTSPEIMVFYAVAFVLVCTLITLAVLIARLHKKLREIAAPIFDQTVHEAQKKAEWVLVDARQQAFDLRIQAEKEAKDITASREKQDAAYAESIRTHIEKLSQHAEELLKQQEAIITQATQRIGENLTQRERAAEAAIGQETDMLARLFREEHERITSAFSTMQSTAQKDYEALTAHLRTQMTEEVARALTAARAAAATYRTEKMALIDRDIVALVEDTARLSLGKALSLEAHRDLVLKALADAKAAGIFTTP